MIIIGEEHDVINVHKGYPALSINKYINFYTFRIIGVVPTLLDVSISSEATPEISWDKQPVVCHPRF